jgi:hypothetical protein
MQKAFRVASKGFFVSALYPALVGIAPIKNTTNLLILIRLSDLLVVAAITKPITQHS